VVKSSSSPLVSKNFSKRKDSMNRNAARNAEKGEKENEETEDSDAIKIYSYIECIKSSFIKKILPSVGFSKRTAKFTLSCTCTK